MVILPSLHITGIHLYGNLPERKLEQELKSKWRLSPYILASVPSILTLRYRIPSWSFTASLPLKIGLNAPKRKPNRLQTIIFQGRAVSFGKYVTRCKNSTNKLTKPQMLGHFLKKWVNSFGFLFILCFLIGNVSLHVFCMTSSPAFFDLLNSGMPDPASQDALCPLLLNNYPSLTHNLELFKGKVVYQPFRISQIKRVRSFLVHCKLLGGNPCVFRAGVLFSLPHLMHYAPI